MMLSEIDARHRLSGERSDGVVDLFSGPGEGGHRAVVVRIGVDIEQVGAARLGQTLQGRRPTPFADVDDALEQGHFSVFSGLSRRRVGVGGTVAAWSQISLGPIWGS